MAVATYQGSVVAESDDTVIVEGNHYFPIESVTDGVLSESPATSVCPWKGTASYYDVTVDGHTAEGAAFHYRDPKPAAEEIRGRVAFWKGVVVTD